MKRILILIFLFYIFVLFQTSFFVHFDSGGIATNLILISVIFISFYGDAKNNLGIYGAIIGGFYLDVFSDLFFGFWVLILLVIALFIRFFVKKYVRIPFLKGI